MTQPTLRSPALRSALVAALLATFAGACGMRTAVRPPEDTAPVVPGEAVVMEKNGETIVRWKRAEASADGRQLTDLAAFVVEKKRADQQEWQTVATIDVIDQEKYRRRQDFSWREPSSESVGAEFRVSAVCADGQQGPPNLAVPRAEAESEEAGKAAAASAAAESEVPSSAAAPAGTIATDADGTPFDSSAEDANTYP